MKCIPDSLPLSLARARARSHSAYWFVDVGTVWPSVAHFVCQFRTMTTANWCHSISMHHYLLVFALLTAHISLSLSVSCIAKTGPTTKASDPCELMQTHYRGRINNCDSTKWLWLRWNAWMCDHSNWNTLDFHTFGILKCDLICSLISATFKCGAQCFH